MITAFLVLFAVLSCIIPGGAVTVGLFTILAAPVIIGLLIVGLYIDRIRHIH